jgi:hypothetical protein
MAEVLELGSSGSASSDARKNHQTGSSPFRYSGRRAQCATSCNSQGMLKASATKHEQASSSVCSSIS